MGCLHRLQNDKQGTANWSVTEIEEKRMTKKSAKRRILLFSCWKEHQNIKTVKKKKDSVVWYCYLLIKVKAIMRRSRTPPPSYRRSYKSQGKI